MKYRHDFYRPADSSVVCFQPSSAVFPADNVGVREFESDSDWRQLLVGCSRVESSRACWGWWGTWTDNDFLLTSKNRYRYPTPLPPWRENAKKSFDWNLGTPQPKHWSPKTCQSLSNPSSLYSTALGCCQLTLEAETKIVQYTLRYYCNSTLLRKYLYTYYIIDMMVWASAWKVERCASLMESCLELIASSSVTNNHSFWCPGSSESIQLFHNIYMYCLARILLAQLGPVDKGCLIPPFHIWSLWIAHIDAC